MHSIFKYKRFAQRTSHKRNLSRSLLNEQEKGADAYVSKVFAQKKKKKDKTKAVRAALKNKQRFLSLSHSSF